MARNLVKRFFGLTEDIKRLARLVGRSVSTIYRWRREGIPIGAKSIVNRVVERKPKAKAPSFKRQVEQIIQLVVPLTAREKRERQAQKALAVAERERIKQRIRLAEREEQLEQALLQKAIQKVQTDIENQKRHALEIAKQQLDQRYLDRLVAVMGEEMLHVRHKTPARSAVIEKIIAASQGLRKRKKKLTDLQKTLVRQSTQWEDDIISPIPFYTEDEIYAYAARMGIDPRDAYTQIFMSY